MKEAFAAARKSCRNVNGPCLEEELISMENMDKIEDAIERIKAIPGRRFGFECALDSKTRNGDFSLSITRKLGEEAISNKLLIEDWYREAASHVEWQCMANFIKQWLDPNSLLYYCINTIYLELDTGNAEGDILIPGIFFRIANETGNGRWYHMMANAALDALKVNTTPLRRKLILDYFDKFSAITSVFQVGVMFSREDHPMKLVALNVPVGRVKGLLHACGCHTLDLLPEEEWNYIAVHTSGTVGVSLDITDKIRKRVGIEIPISRQRNKEAWELLCNWIVNKGYCSRDKYQAVLNWIGSSCIQSDKAENSVLINRTISHLKLDIAPERPIRAKIYLEYSAD